MIYQLGRPRLESKYSLYIINTFFTDFLLTSRLLRIDTLLFYSIVSPDTTDESPWCFSATRVLLHCNARIAHVSGNAK